LLRLRDAPELLKTALFLGVLFLSVADDPRQLLDWIDARVIGAMA
jgi:hypothetical protein